MFCHRLVTTLYATLTCFIFTSVSGWAACSSQDYIAHARAGLSDEQIKTKCQTPMPPWLAGQWTVTLMMKDFHVDEPTAKKQEGFTPFTPFVQGMKSFTDLADKPDQRRDELWLMTTGTNKLTLNRIFNPKYNPQNTNFIVNQPQGQSGHQLMSSVIKDNKLVLNIISPPYGDQGIEYWSFEIDMFQTTKTDLLSGRYQVRRKNRKDNKTYRHTGSILLAKAAQ